MKTMRVLLLINGLLTLTTIAVFAQASNLATNIAANAADNVAENVATNLAVTAPTNAPNAETPIPELGQPLLSERVKASLTLTAAQRVKVKIIEDDFANATREYQTANQPRIEAAYEAVRRARQANNEAELKAAWDQVKLVWAGLQSDRTAGLTKVKTVLTPDQLKIFEAEKNPSSE